MSGSSRSYGCREQPHERDNDDVDVAVADDDAVIVESDDNTKAKNTPKIMETETTTTTTTMGVNNNRPLRGGGGEEICTAGDEEREAKEEEEEKKEEADDGRYGWCNDIIKSMFLDLSEDEMEVAARASYGYRAAYPSRRVARKKGEDDDDDDDDDDDNETNWRRQVDRQRYALEYVKRFWFSKMHRWKDPADKLRKNLAFRKERRIDRLLDSFEKKAPTIGEDEEDGDDDEEEEEFRRRLYEELSDGKLYVRGYDRVGRATYVFVPRKVRSHDDVRMTMNAHLYTLERAAECTRRRTRRRRRGHRTPSHPDDIDDDDIDDDCTTASFPGVNAVVDFTGFSMTRHGPPVKLAKEFMTTLRDHYAGYVNRILLVNAPKSFLYLWKMLQPFLGTETKSKVLFPYYFNHDENDFDDVVSELYDDDQSPTSWLFSSSSAASPSAAAAIDIREYLCETPFDATHDETRGTR